MKARELGHHDPDLYTGKTITLKSGQIQVRGPIQAHRIHVARQDLDGRFVETAIVTVTINGHEYEISGEDEVAIQD